MNMREGMRRVGIVLGALGCVAGGAIGYWDLQNVWSSHTRFERLQALPVMIDVNAALKPYQGSLESHGATLPESDQYLRETHPDYAKMAPKDREAYLDEMHYGAQPKPEAPDKIVEVSGVGNVLFPGGMSDDKIAEAIKSYRAQHKTQQTTKEAPIALPPLPRGATLVPDFIPDYAVQAADTHDRAAADDPAAEFTVDVKGTDGIQTVNADKGGVISSIQLTTGEWVRRGAKTLKGRLALVASLLLPFCFPMIGFLVPWGTIRVFVWVAGGFSATPNHT